jgi:hypothetical protein
VERLVEKRNSTLRDSVGPSPIFNEAIKAVDQQLNTARREEKASGERRASPWFAYLRSLGEETSSKKPNINPPTSARCTSRRIGMIPDVLHPRGTHHH